MIELAGDDPTMLQIAEAMSGALGRPIEYREVAAADMAPDIRPKAGTQRWLEDVGWQIDIAELAQTYPVPLTSIAQWTHRHRATLGTPETA